MKVKYYLLSMAAIGLLTACSGEKKEVTTENGKATTEKKVAEADQPTGDVFIYTGEHRRSKIQPDKAKVLISKKLASINTNEFSGNTTIEEIWIGDQVQHILRCKTVPAAVIDLRRVQAPQICVFAQNLVHMHGVGRHDHL